MNKKLFSFLLMCLVSLSVFAQTTQVTGVVYDDQGETLPGASVIVKGTTIGVSTDFDGNFTLNVPDVKSQTLQISSIGFEPQEVSLANQTTGIKVSLQASVQMVEEIVAVGYGTMKKKDLTGSVAQVGSDALRDIPVSSASEAITGRMAGVQVVTTEGSPDAEVKIRVRGGGSISQDNSPLYIVDGFPVSSISNIPPTDIQDITVLKDASSTAIYGARGANGVILITTKSGKEGRINVSFNSYFGVRQRIKSLPVLSPYEYVMYQYELDQSSTFQGYYGVYDDLDIYKSVKGTDWQDKVFGRTATQQYYNLGISGGAKNTTFNLSLTRSDEEAIMLTSGFQRNNLNFKLKTEISDNVSLDFNTRMSHSVVDGAGTSSDKSGANTKLRNAVKYAPTTGLREFSQGDVANDDINSPEATSLLYDPVESVLDEYKKQFRLNMNFNAALNWKIAKPLTFRTEWGYAFTQNRTDYVWGEATSTAKNYAGQPVGRIYNYDGENWRFANTLTFDKNDILPNQDLTVLLGQEMSSSWGKSVTNESRFFPAGMSAEDVLAMFNLGTAIPTVTSIGAKDNLSSFFTRVNYSIDDKYLITATMRADGSSKFAEGNRWGYFPSLAFGWRMSEEGFMESSHNWLYNLKLRASYGSSGNNRIDSGLWRTSYTTDNDNKPYYPNESEASQLIPSTALANKDLRWETTHTANLGFDYGLFEGRVNGSLDFYYNRTVDLLIDQPVPESTGYSTQMMNVGQTSNRGIEFVVDAVLVDKRDFTLNASFNITFNRNRVDKFSNGEYNYKTYSSGWNGSAAPTSDYIIREGEEVGQMYGYVTDGMYSFDDFTFDNTSNSWKLNEFYADGVTPIADNSSLTSAGAYFGPGALKLKDLNGDGVIDENDKTVLGSAQPIHTGGFNLTAKYKNWDASAFMNWSYGNEVYNANKLDYSSQLLSRKYQNLITDMDMAHRFTTIDPSTGLNIYSGNDANPALLQEINQGKSMWMPLHTTTVLHSYAVEDGSFLRLNNVTVGYTMPFDWKKGENKGTLRMYFTGYNLAILTNYSGFDPEVDTRRSTPLTPGVDYSAYPRSRQYVVGLNLTF
ncbi:SusC/RagA family TonB-linked outer membrane protein [Mangrovibacterium diazotrophicum]|uniref:TonB-linked SusC/RagA family outer membrane protein n=1 Tax=Mangrovibacterium diazotrophicum TaxID=1261403 RepID=A0A419W3D5_9BACT|nr:TonB-dependent receptor [Mangrovibacterium diazotrophicum]RKD89978.1 TonB-linked SusC/RagA family outer membrane protein [Mangrovibacterium diazotrophicum]